MLPTEDPAVIDRFCEDFHVSRGDEDGLSVVIPWYESGDSEGGTAEKVIAAVLKGFFYPILMGSLEVTVDDASGLLPAEVTSQGSQADY